MKEFIAVRGWRWWLLILQNWHWESWGFNFNEGGYYLSYSLNLRLPRFYFWMYLGNESSFSIMLGKWPHRLKRFKLIKPNRISKQYANMLRKHEIV